MVDIKLCNTCKIEKPVSDFNLCKSTKDGLQGHCRVCSKLKCKQYHLTANKQAIKTRSTAWKKANKNRVIEHRKKWDSCGRKTWKQNNPEYMKEYFIKNPQKAKKLGAAWEASIKLKSSILNRDNYSCQLCDSKNNLIMHHILPKNNSPELIAEEKNLIILCKSCHLYKAHAGCNRNVDVIIQKQLLSIIETKYIESAV